MAEKKVQNKDNGKPTIKDQKILTNILNIQKEKIQTLSAVVARTNLANALGQRYDGDRDLYEALGYKTTLIYDDYISQYSRHDMTKAVIDRPVKVTWSGDIKIVESKIEGETNLEKEWIALQEKLKLKTKFVRLDKLTGLGGFGVMLLGFDDVRNTNGYSHPVKKGGRKLLYVRPLGASSAKISGWEKNVANERYGLPLFYDIILLNPDGGESVSLKVHYTRVLHVVEDTLESETEGTPRLKCVFNRLMDLEKLVGGSAEMFWRGARPGYSGEINPEYSLGSTEEDALMDQIDEYEHNLRRIFINEGISLKALEIQISDPGNHVDVQIQMLSAASGIPKRILTGSERGELASSQDATEWISFVQGRREDFAEPNIIRPFVDRMIEMGVFSTPKDGYTMEWADLFAISEKDKANIGRIRATSLREYFVNPMTPQVVPLKAFYEICLGLSRSQIEKVSSMKVDDTYREIREADAEFQAKLKQGAEPVVIPETNPTAGATDDKKTK